MRRAATDESSRPLISFLDILGRAKGESLSGGEPTMRTLAIAAIAGAALMLPHTTRAALFTVNSTADGIEPSPAGDEMCAKLGHTCTLRAAIMKANALAGADTITLPSGTYTLSIPGGDEDAGATGDLDITDDLRITGAGAAVTIIDGNHLDRVFDVHSPAQVTLSGLTITNGEPPAETDAGGMLNAGTLTLNGVTFLRNHAGHGGGWGGGLKNLGTATLAQVTFLSNRGGDAYATHTDSGSAGGAGGMWNVGAATLSDVTFRANRGGDGSRNADSDPTGGDCGGLMNDGDVTLSNVTFSLNRAGDGAKGGGFGGYAGGMENFGRATLAKVTFDRNRAGNGGSNFLDGPGDGGGGGGLQNFGTTTLDDCSFVGNRAGRVGTGTAGGYGGSGGGIENDEGSITLTRVTLDRNSAGKSTWGFGGAGGGLLSVARDTLTNVTITRNRAGDGPNYLGGGGEGGGLFVADATLTNVTIALNRAGKGKHTGDGDNGGDQIFVEGTATLTNTIIFGGKNNCDPFGRFFSLGHNLDSGITCQLNGPGDISNADPQLERVLPNVALPDNGGVTATLALLPGSPAVDAGDNTVCPATDQRGLPRPQGAACDIGAYELEP